MIREGGADVLSASSRLMLSATRSCDSLLRASASATRFSSASSVFCDSASRSWTVTRARLNGAMPRALGA